MRQTGEHKEKGSVLVMAVVLSFAMFVLGLSYLSTVDHVENMISEEIRGAQRVYGGTHNNVTNALVKTGSLYPGRYGLWNEFIDDKAWYRDMVQFTTTLDDEDFMYGSARGYLVYTEIMTSFYGAANPLIGHSIKYEILETFADYLYLSHKEEDPVRNERIRFWTPDTLDGKVHSNDTIHIHSVYNRPRFMKKTTSCAPFIVPPNHQATFDEGFYPNSDSIYFPDQAEEIRIRTFRSNFGTFHPDSVTELTLDGRRIIVRFCGFGEPPYEDSLICTPSFISASTDVMIVPGGDAALFVHGKVYIKANRNRPDLMDTTFRSDGFEGRLTIASSDTMIIYDNLIYTHAASDNSVPVEIIDCLGLISESAIMIGDSVRDTVYINAALASIGGTISVRDIYDYGTCSQPNNNEKQSLFIYGSLAMLNRGIVHTTHGDCGTTCDWGCRGFIEKDYHYDTRFQMNPPPYFIRTSEHNSIYMEYVEE